MTNIVPFPGTGAAQRDALPPTELPNILEICAAGIIFPLYYLFSAQCGIMKTCIWRTIDQGTL